MATASQSALNQELRTLVNENLLFGQADALYSDDDSFMERGIIDSTGVLELVKLLEDKFGIEVEDEDLIPENLDSIRSLARFIESKRGSGDVGEAACR